MPPSQRFFMIWNICFFSGIRFKSNFSILCSKLQNLIIFLTIWMKILKNIQIFQISSGKIYGFFLSPNQIIIYMKKTLLHRYPRGMLLWFRWSRIFFNLHFFGISYAFVIFARTPSRFSWLEITLILWIICGRVQTFDWEVFFSKIIFLHFFICLPWREKWFWAQPLRSWRP